MSLTVIELENMEFQAFHGCYPLEQIVGNRFRVNVRIEADLSKAELSDEVSDTINYLKVYETVRREMAIKSHILEHVARRIDSALRREFSPIRHLRVKVSKMAPPLGGKIDSVAVTVED